MEIRNVIQVVPAAPDDASGVSDFAAVIADGLAAKFGVQASVLHTVSTSDGPAGIAPGACRRSRPGIQQAILEFNPDETAVLLHFEPYGYQKRGVPLWVPGLVGGLRRAGFRVGTFLHELFAAGQPWQSSFWLGPLQARISRNVAAGSNFAVTSIGEFGQILRRWLPGHQIDHLPIPSCIGEPGDPVGVADKQPIAIVFGRAGMRRRLYQDFGDQLGECARTLGIGKIVDVGDPIDIPLAGSVPIEPTGRLPAADVKQLARQAQYGAIAYSHARLGKSSVFGTFAAFGCVPLVFGQPGAADGLAADRHFVDGLRGQGASDPRALANHLAEWYQGHNISAHCLLLADRFGIRDSNVP